jgi:hypothetical protein
MEHHLFHCQLIDWGYNGADIFDESLVETSKTEEAPHLAQILRWQPLTNSFDLFFIHLNTLT